MSEVTLLRAGTDGAFVEQASAYLIAGINQAIADRGVCIVGLSGGSTPGPVYHALGRDCSVDWSRVWLFLTDDRYVPPDDPNSNQFLLQSTLLRYAPVPEARRIFPDMTLPLAQCVDSYEQRLKDLFEKGSPDLTVLGMGEDGHVASLFPPLGNEAFGPRLAIHTVTEEFSVRDRISVTMPVLTRSRKSFLLLKGEGKRHAWEEMGNSTEGGKRWPAKEIAAKTPMTVAVQW